jgi:hypothetical protein
MSSNFSEVSNIKSIVISNYLMIEKIIILEKTFAKLTLIAFISCKE